jgi:hypothetical protein
MGELYDGKTSEFELFKNLPKFYDDPDEASAKARELFE